MGNCTRLSLIGMFVTALAAAGPGAAEWNRQAAQLYSQGRYAEAETLYRDALQTFDGERVNRALTMENLAVMLRAEGRYPESEKLHVAAIAALEAATGNGSLETVRAVSNLAALYWSWGKLEKAERLALRAGETFDALSSPADQAANGQILASIYLAGHRFDDATKLLNRIAGLGEPLQIVSGYINLSAAAIGLKENARAEEYARRALELAARDLPPRHSLVASALNNLAQACRFQDKYLEAEKNYREAIEILDDSVGVQHPDTARAMLNLAAFFHERGREAGAEDLYLRAAEIFERAFGRSNAQALVARNELADVLRAERRFTESERLARSSLAEMEGAFSTGDPRLSRALQNYARLLAETDRTAQAKKVWAKTLR